MIDVQIASHLVVPETSPILAIHPSFFKRLDGPTLALSRGARTARRRRLQRDVMQPRICGFNESSTFHATLPEPVGELG